MLIDVKETSFYLYIIDMAAFDQMRLLHLKKKYQLCALFILKRIKFAKQRRKRICWIRKIRSSCFTNFTGKYLCWSLCFNKFAGLQLY